VDFPAFGRPTMATNPARFFMFCSASFSAAKLPLFAEGELRELGCSASYDNRMPPFQFTRACSGEPRFLLMIGGRTEQYREFKRKFHLVIIWERILRE